jgi:hypothetical protein
MVPATTPCGMTPTAVSARSASDEAVPTVARETAFSLAVTGPKDVISSEGVLCRSAASATHGQEGGRRARRGGSLAETALGDNLQ